jgi:hypothetical protein
LLAALLASPFLFQVIGVPATILLCGLAALAVSGAGLTRFAPG